MKSLMDIYEALDTPNLSKFLVTEVFTEAALARRLCTFWGKCI